MRCFITSQFPICLSGKHIVLGCLFAVLSSVVLSAQPLTKEQVDKIGIDQRLNEQLPLDLSFYDESGHPVQLKEYFGKKPVILTLAYYECPMLCTQVINGLVRALKPLTLNPGDDFTLITVSIDPGETAIMAQEKKAQYLHYYNRSAEADWHFLTGDQSQIEKLAEAVGFRYQYDAELDQYMHASGIIILTPTGKLARYFYGIDYTPKDIRLGLVEAADHKIGSPVDQLLLLCYQYDPMTGKYGFVIMTTLRLAGVATVAVLGSFIVVMLRRERRKPSNIA
jgi:protein SCO1/2